ncbi:MAG: zinc ribbon domain-containing protein [Chloroflexi bacterium]|nr:zinc ribbon domain-containing protein [Chloroflexota bacterium]
MPLYEYSCTSCGHGFEVLRAMAQADDPAICPRCSNSGKRRMSRVASFAKGDDGVLSPVGGGSSCGGCSSGNCGSCSV